MQHVPIPAPECRAQDRRFLIVGLSHTNCMATHLARHPDPRFAVINRRRTDVEAEGFVWPFEAPDVLCLSVQGNAHNVLSLFEHPVPYSVGAEGAGDPGRTAIPHAVFLDFMIQRMKNVFWTIKKMKKAFPDAHTVMLTPPPPVEDLSKIDELPDVLKKQVHLGFAPAALRLAVYNAQVAATRTYAERCEIGMLPVPQTALTENGMLSPDYALGDPTHANAAYGALLLRQIESLGGLTQ